MTRAEVQSNFYDVLRVDRDAPVSVIRDSYRRLMQHAGNHPDLGGDTRTAAVINKAYAVLSDPEQRRDYDLRLGIMHRVTAGVTAAPAPRRLDPDLDCLFCEQRHGVTCRAAPGASCPVCGSPLQAVTDLPGESPDQRAVQRLQQRFDVAYFTHWPQSKAYAARSEDVSPHGLRLVTHRQVRAGQRIRLVCDTLEAVGEISYCIPRYTRWRTEYVAGIAFLTLRFARSVGAFVSRRA